jgi:hypothetical protein
MVIRKDISHESNIVFVFLVGKVVEFSLLLTAVLNWKDIEGNRFMLQKTVILCFVAILTATSCQDSSNNSSENSNPATELALLSAGKHVSFIRGFNAVQPSATNMAMEDRWQEALNHGMDVGRIQVDWVDLEPQSNQFDKSYLEQKLTQMENDGLEPFVLLSAIDSEGYTLPNDLVDPNSNTLLTNDMQFDDPIILARFKNLLDWVVPMIVAHGGWVLAIGNEPGNFIVDHPEVESEVVNFLSSALDHAHGIDSQLAITMTLAFGNIEQGYSFHESILEYVDVASYNYYASDTDYFFDNNSSNINQEIDIMLAAAGSKQVIFQELGAAGGYEHTTSLMNTSLTDQAEFFETVFSRMQAEERLRVAVVFQLVDWDPDLVDLLYSQILIQEGFPEEFVLRFEESLVTTGLIRYSDGSSRPSWNKVLEYIELFASH